MLILLLTRLAVTLAAHNQIHQFISKPGSVVPCGRLVAPSVGAVPTSLLPFLLTTQLPAVLGQVELTGSVSHSTEHNSRLLLSGLINHNYPVVVAAAILWSNGTITPEVRNPSLDWTPEGGEGKLSYNLSSVRWKSVYNNIKEDNPVYFVEALCDEVNQAAQGKFYVVLRWKLEWEDSLSSPSVLLVWLSTEEMSLNQCMNRTENIVSKCSMRNLTQCLPSTGSGLVLGSYKCCCWNRPSHCINGTYLENEWTTETNFTSLCYPGDPILRKILLSITAVTTILSISLIFFVLTQRRVKETASRGWALMEICLLGAIFMYAIVIIEYVSPPEAWSCAIVVWFRELGFVAFYGSIILKIYRNLVEYRVRKAHHVYVKEKDMLKYLACLLVLTTTGLLAWTLATSQGRDKTPFLDVGITAQYSTYSICRFQWWSIAWQLYELALLAYGLRLGYKTRNTDWGEKWQFTAAVLLETLLTLVASVLKYKLMLVTDQDAMLLLTFAHIHATVSINLLLILVPKLFLQFYFFSDHRRQHSIAGVSSTGRAHPSLAKLRDNLVNGTIDFAQVPINDMNPEDIRAELKRVYTTLRMFKVANMYQGNPHIEKKKARGVRAKASDKIPLKRRTSNQTSIASPVSPRPTADNRSERMEMSFVGDEECQPLTSGGQSGGQSGTSVRAKDLTVLSSPHNIYLSRGALAATKKLSLEPDHSVRV